VDLFEFVATQVISPGEWTDRAKSRASAFAQRTTDAWHRFVTSGDPEIPRPLLAEDIVFRSPFVQSPDSRAACGPAGAVGGGADLENFTYHRGFIAAPHDAALEFAANIGKWQPKDIDLVNSVTPAK